METSNYISLLGFFVSLISAGVACSIFKFNKNESKKRTVYHMHQLWSSEYYRRCRADAYNGSQKKKQGSEKIALSSISETDLGTALGTVEHFFLTYTI